MRTIALIVGSAAALWCAGCKDLLLKDLRMDVEAGEPSATAVTPDGKPMWEEQLLVRNQTTMSLHEVRLVINPEAFDTKAGYVFNLPEPLEPGAKPRIALAAFRNRDGKSFPPSELDIVEVRFESKEGTKSFRGTTLRRRMNQLDYLP